MKAHESQHAHHHTKQRSMYLNLLIMAIISFIVMFVLMYAMVDTFAHAVPNINQVYMAGLMTAAMVIIEIAIMHSMYRKNRLNIVIIAISIVALVGCWFGIREQFLVGDKAFLESMIPHHSGAILMCDKAQLTDQDIIALCDKIKQGQADEIQLMEEKLRNP